MASEQSLWLARRVNLEEQKKLEYLGCAPWLASILASRGGVIEDTKDPDLCRLLRQDQLTGASTVAKHLAEAILLKKHIVIVADYDADGATACAIGVAGLRAFGAWVDYVVPDRFVLGYGLSPAVVQKALELKPDIIVTVDNGISSHEGVLYAREQGIAVLITDHHLAADTLPDALAIVNPNVPVAHFDDGATAGVGVMFYVLVALRAELKNQGDSHANQVNLAQYLDRVALGTVADLVPLTANNRLLIQVGLSRMRRGLACPGIEALFQVSQRNSKRASTADLGFMLGPRLNAAGRMENMAVGIECLLASDPEQALVLAWQLNDLNQQRKSVEADMQDDALHLVPINEDSDRLAIVLKHPDWHIGVVGILASRIKERTHQPTLIFALDPAGLEYKGSGRSVPGFHMRDALSLVALRQPQTISRFGGHAMAAGVTVPVEHWSCFVETFEAVTHELWSLESRLQILWHDGQSQALSVPQIQTLEQMVWGQGFAEPRFWGGWVLKEQKLVGSAHRQFSAWLDGQCYRGICFNQKEPLPEHFEALYCWRVNEWQGYQSVQVELCHWRYNN